MLIVANKSLKDFDFWSQAAVNASRLTDGELDAIEDALQMSYEKYATEGIGETELNDIFWFEFGSVCELLGLNEDEVYDREVYRPRGSLRYERE